MRVLVTGGAGYIGSHVVLQLAEGGHEAVVYDNLSSGFAWAVLDSELVVGDLADTEKLERLVRERSFDAVVHLAAHVSVPDSVADPLKYYRNNTCNTAALLDICGRFGVGIFIFSSTAAAYGIPDRLPVGEDAPLAPINPYGASKVMSERMILDLAAVAPLRYLIFRYFNVAGADPQGRIGQATPAATHLIKVGCETALKKRPDFTVFGTDYSTPDGTCVRDFIHVVDIARAHIEGLRHLRDGGRSAVLNVGYGHGSSVLEVIEVVKRVAGVDFPVDHGPRRPGDPPELVADNRRIGEVLGWEPRHDDLDFIVRTALDWERKMGD